MKTKEEILKKGCGLKESCGSPICEEGNLCDDCENELKGFQQGKTEARKEFLEFLRNLHKRAKKMPYIHLKIEVEDKIKELEKLGAKEK